MTSAPRPKIRDPKTIAFFVILVLGFVMLSITAALTPDQRLEKVPANGGPDASFVLKTTPFWVYTFSTLSYALITASTYELLNLGFQYYLWFRYRRAFDQFFGKDAADRCGDGVIIIQADTLDSMLTEYNIENAREQINRLRERRLYKARTWINLADTKGARTIITRFRELNLKPPHLRFWSRHKPPELQENTPFIISMGLGHAESTGKYFREATAGWMHVERTGEYGDVVELHHRLVNDELHTLDYMDGAKNFRRLHPKNWELDRWLDGKTPVNDYAVILRHTDCGEDADAHDSPRQVRFMLAGFTERGTQAAGTYLALKWEKLWAKNVRNKHDSEGRGDFMIVISGPSHWVEDADHSSFLWEEDPDFKPVTPEALAEIVDLRETPWAQRIKREG